MTYDGTETCCLCGGPLWDGYQQDWKGGNNPYPLGDVPKDRCCDACNEIVIEARIVGKSLMAELDRVEEALGRLYGAKNLTKLAIAAICASRGPGLLAQKRETLAKLREKANVQA